MKLSVCIFTYNHAEYIAKTIEGVLMQKTKFDFEIVIGEDCSNDGTQDLLREYEKMYPNKFNIKYNGINRGMMLNNMETIKRCKGEYISLLDGDDFWNVENKLQKQVDFLEANEEYSFCFHDGKILLQNGRLDSRNCCNYGANKDVCFTDIIYKVSVPTFSIVFRRSAIIDYPPKWFKKLNAPDRPLFLLLASKGKGYYMDECLGTYRLHRNGCWTGQHYQSRWLTHLQIHRTVNNHFRGRYQNWFRKYSSLIYYLLAIDLLKDGKLKRAICCLKRYVQLDKKSNTLIRTVNILRFYFLLVLTKFQRSKSDI